jgi:16S rRNA (guanine527-N7)-methyltransferase
MFALTDKQKARCELYLDEMYRWNERVNLTSVDREHAWVRHIEEGLEFAALITGSDRVVDIGSGGGVPGVVVALAQDAEVTLVEADQRKAGFLMHVAGLLELDNVTVVAARAETLANAESHRAAYNVAVSRAAGPLPVVLGWCLPLLRGGGSVLISSRDQPGEADLPLPAVRAGRLLRFVKPE